MSNTPSLRELEHHGAFLERHIGPNDAEIAHMLRVVGHASLDAMTDAQCNGTVRRRLRPLPQRDGRSTVGLRRRADGQRTHTADRGVVAAISTTINLQIAAVLWLRR